MIAADTSAILHFLHGFESPSRLAVRQALIDRELVLPPVVVTELLSGPDREARLDDVLAIASRLPVIEGFWDRAGENRRIIVSKGLRARLADTLVAQSCLDVDASLIAGDTDFRHFATHCGLKLAT